MLSFAFQECSCCYASGKASNRPNLMRYVKEMWSTWRDRFVTSFFSKNKRHYGHCTTARVVSAHAALKSGFLSPLTIFSQLTLMASLQQLFMKMQNNEQL